eukprot:s164_g38.t1
MPKLKIAGFANAVANAENGMQTFRRLNGSGRVQNLVKRYEMRGSSQDPSELRVPRAERSSGSRSDRAAPLSHGVPSQEDADSEVPYGRARSVDSCRSRGTMASSVFRARSLDSALRGDLAVADDFSMELSSKRTPKEASTWRQGGCKRETNALHEMTEGNTDHKVKEPRPAPMLPLPSRQVVEAPAPRRRWRCCQCFERLQQHRVPLLSGA